MRMIERASESKDKTIITVCSSRGPTTYRMPKGCRHDLGAKTRRQAMICRSPHKSLILTR